MNKIQRKAAKAAKNAKGDAKPLQVRFVSREGGGSMWPQAQVWDCEQKIEP